MKINPLKSVHDFNWLQTFVIFCWFYNNFRKKRRAPDFQIACPKTPVSKITERVTLQIRLCRALLEPSPYPSRDHDSKPHNQPIQRHRRKFTLNHWALFASPRPKRAKTNAILTNLPY